MRIPNATWQWGKRRLPVLTGIVALIGLLLVAFSTGSTVYLASDDLAAAVPQIVTLAFDDTDADATGVVVDFIFMSDMSGTNQIYRAHTNTTESEIQLSQLTDEEDGVIHYVYDPDMREITYLSETSIMRMDIDVGDVEIVRSLPAAIPGQVIDWQPDNTIVFVDFVGSLLNHQASTCSVFGAYSYDLESDEITPLFSVEDENYKLQDDGTYAYDGLLPSSRYCSDWTMGGSPIAALLSHQGDRTINTSHRYYFGASFGSDTIIYDLDTDERIVLELPGTPGVIRWSPDDRYLIYHVRTEMQRSSIGIVSSDGETAFLLLSDDRFNFANPYWIRPAAEP